MGTFLSILLDILAILAIIIVGSLVVVVIAELILHVIGDKKHDEKEDGNRGHVVNDDDIVVYTGENPSENTSTVTTKSEFVDGDQIEEIDYDKAIEEQKALQAKQGKVTTQEVKPEQKPVEKAPKNQDIFWDDEEEDEFNALLDEVVKEAKKAGEEKTKKEDKLEEKAIAESKKAELDEETKKELEELKALKEQHQKELEEFKQLKEDFAREKEEQLAMLKDNLNKTKEEEIEQLKQEALKEQEKLEQMKAELEQEKAELEEEKAKLKEEPAEKDAEPIVKETIIKDEEEINKLKYKNLMRMNSRLTRIIRDTEKLQDQKQKAIERQAEEKRKAEERQEQERLKEQERQIELDRQEQERQRKILEAEQKKVDIQKKLHEASKKASKYKLDSKIVKISNRPIATEQVTEIVEDVVTTETISAPVQRESLKPSSKPLFEKDYYEQKIAGLEEELKEAEKEFRINKSEYIPLTRIHKAYARDSEKLRKKEMQVAKQKVALYGVNSKNVDPAKKQKLDENLQALAELKDSVQHCEEVIKKNKDRYPILEKNNKLIERHIQKINDDIKVCEKAIDYYNKGK